MKLTQDQQKAKDLFDKWWKSDEQCFVLNGLAGTGKTTIAKELANGKNAVFAAYTGKAASVLKSKGIEEVGTLHGLIYIPKQACAKRLQDLETQYEREPSEELMFLIKRERINLSSPRFCLNLSPEGICGKNLIVVDESSMVDKTIGQDLLSFDIKVLALGDPGQLPPINGTQFFTKPNYTLTDIIRHKNDIIKLAYSIRTYGEILSSRENFKVFDKSEMGNLDGYDCIIVWRNETRRILNNRFKKHNELLQAGDKICCLTNSFSYGIMNGTVWEVVRVGSLDTGYDKYLGSKEIVWATITDGLSQKVVPILTDILKGNISSEEAGYLRARESKSETPEWLLFDYGWVLTCHKAQGSEWDKVAVIVPNNTSNEWLYTAVTRAKEQVDLYV